MSENGPDKDSSFLDLESFFGVDGAEPRKQPFGPVLPDLGLEEIALSVKEILEALKLAEEERERAKEELVMAKVLAPEVLFVKLSKVLSKLSSQIDGPNLVLELVYPEFNLLLAAKEYLLKQKEFIVLLDKQKSYVVYDNLNREETLVLVDGEWCLHLTADVYLPLNPESLNDTIDE